MDSWDRLRVLRGVDFSDLGAAYSWGLMSGLEDHLDEEVWVELRVVGLDCFGMQEGSGMLRSMDLGIPGQDWSSLSRSYLVLVLVGIEL